LVSRITTKNNEKIVLKFTLMNYERISVRWLQKSGNKSKESPGKSGYQQLLKYRTTIAFSLQEIKDKTKQHIFQFFPKVPTNW